MANVTSYNVLQEALSYDTARNLELLKAAAKISDPGYGEWAYDVWDDYNRRYWSGRLQLGGISWGLTPHGHSLGEYAPWRNHITLHVSLVTPKSKTAWGVYELLGPHFAADVLLHEMIHQANFQIDGYAGADSHNCEPWCNEIVRLSPLVLGIEVKAEPVKLRRVNGAVTRAPKDGYIARKDLASWPYSLRPASYYEPTAVALLRKVKIAGQARTERNTVQSVNHLGQTQPCKT